MKSNIKLICAYDGTSFLGFQKTKEGRSVEEELERAIATIVQHKVELQGASRTDRGVHATHQVVNFFTDKSLLDLSKFFISINQLLPEDIRVFSVQFEKESFHPTLDARSKEYQYLISLGKTQLPTERFTHWHQHLPLKLEEMKKAAHHFLGTHDFVAFCNARKNLVYEDTTRTLFECGIEQRENTLRILLQGDRFLYKMARNIVGTLVYVGLGKLQTSDIPEIFQKKKRIHAAITAPAHGLTLIKIHYEGTLCQHQ